MDVEIVGKLRGTKLSLWKELLESSGLTVDQNIDRIALVWDNDELVATASRCENLFKCIAVKANRQGEDLTASVISALRADAFAEGYKHLFLYTKPENERIFSSLFFYPVASTDRVILMENLKDGISSFITSLKPKKHEGKVGALVMNCNPFTLGHQSLVEKAARECEHVYIFVLSEDKSCFSTKDRFEMVKLGTSHLGNVDVLPTGPYLISSATFPSYFIKDRDRITEIQCLLDIEIFTKYFVPAFSITTRYVGTEPTSPLTAKYNQALMSNLPPRGIELREIERTKSDDVVISASLVREYIEQKEIEKLKSLVPQTTLNYLINKDLI